jgi:hypothetical protein
LRLVGRGALCLLLLLWAGPPSLADESPESPRVGLDQLLELPADLEYGVSKRGGMTRGEWRNEFRRLRAALEYQESQLELSRRELESIAGSANQWSVGPPIPGASASSDSPLDYRLRQEITRQKAEIERLERALRELEVQANLAGVPAEWRT